MKEKITSLLVAKFPGVRKDGLAQLARTLALTVTTEEEAGNAVEQLDDTKVNEFVTEWRSEVDYEVSRGNKTFEANLKKKFDLVEKGAPKGDEPPSGPTGDPDIATLVKNAVSELIKPLSDELGAFKGAELSKNRLSLLESKLASAPSTFKERIIKDFGRMSFESDEAFTEYLTETETDLQKFSQELADNGLSRFSRPFQRTDAGAEAISAATQAYLDSKAGKGASELGGKEV